MKRIITTVILCATLMSCYRYELVDKRNEYTVYFNSNGGSVVPPQTVKEGRWATLPDPPTRDRYTFLGWFYGDQKWDFTTAITRNITLSAKWEQHTFIVYFDCVAGGEVEPQTIKKGGKAAEPSFKPTLNGYSFDGWFVWGSFNKWDFANIVTSDMLLYAKWISTEKFEGIEGISFENYPRVDGSTSSTPFNRMVACNLLGISHTWERILSLFHIEYTVHPNGIQIPENHRNFFGERIKSSQTHGAFMNLIDGNVDIIVTHRTISQDEKTYAYDKKVTLIETPIASDAFVFVVNKNNPVKSLTVEQIQKIYTGEITNWLQVGGKNSAMQVFTRPRNSGSEEVFRTLVMKGLQPLDFPESEISTMMGVFPELRDYDGICYTFNAYKDLQVRVHDMDVPKIAINGVFPNKNTVQDMSYPLISEVYVAIRSDLDRNSKAYKLYEWLQSKGAKQTIFECGFIPK